MTPAAVVLRVAGYGTSNVLRSRWLLAYVGFFAVVTDALLRFGGGDGRALLSLVNVVLFVVPLVALVFGTTYLYDAREFTELLLTQPVGRPPLFGGLLLGLALPLAVGFVAGVGLPFAIHGLGSRAEAATLATLLACGVALTLVFVALAFVIATRCDDKVRGLGAAVGLWLALGLVYDGAVLLAVAVFADYPVERPLLAAMLTNPIDLARVLLLLRFDVAALLGYTGAVFARFFGGTAGSLVAASALLAWIVLPLGLGLRAFRRRDF
ncbi:nitrous-oxide metabolic protein NosY (plasmid) [Gemmatirosa kalamazoonensis]|uniref:Nitrous-oxide metabolic protein NosY n=1 Tax=Gemmatirosa kalamazoonensis TaxID=861299 RepID=W0RSJ8_9BACT|nr:ABC transporter permease subunit [Gemmatirosa kalamazoonensis]AHG92563.1 nitrous-oxide metabolic protein NosY [Gemmatirosa kalamazoonensis]